MTVTAMSRAELKVACLELLDRVALEHPAGHQGKLAARYIMRSVNDDRVSMMFEKNEKTKPHLWIDHRFARGLMDAEIEFRVSLASSLYQAAEPGKKPLYGRHAALRSMRDMANVDLVRFTIDRLEQMQMVLAKLTAAP